MVLFDLADSMIKNVFCDIVKPKVGSVVKTRLIGGVITREFMSARIEL